MQSLDEWNRIVLARVNLVRESVNNARFNHREVKSVGLPQKVIA